MTVQLQQSWEYQLLSLAEEALKTPLSRPMQPRDKSVLQTAYAHCSDITREHSRTFYLASSLLPEDKRRAARALYAFCRITDDIVDNAQNDAACIETLAAWRQLSAETHPSADDPVALAWADTRADFGIPSGYAEQLISGVSCDLVKKRYQTFDELAEYAYGVASTVGLMAMHIIGFTGEAALPYAVRLGVALQITNILRDVGEDWAAGRLYLPLDELDAFGLGEANIAQGKVDERWRNFMRFQIQRNRRLYDESIDGIALLNRDGRFAIAAAAELYQGILDDIEANDYDVFSRRAHLSNWAKARRLPGIWWRSRKASIALPK